MYRSAVNDYPASIVPVNHVAPVPRRIRAYLGAEKVLDTTRALYVWEWPHYPQYYIPLDDVRRDVLVSEGHTQRTRRGLAELHGLEAGAAHRPRAASTGSWPGLPTPRPAGCCPSPAWSPSTTRWSTPSSTASH